jgi:MFS family permease
MQVIPAAARERASARFVAIYALAYAALWLALLTPAIITLALRVRQLAPGNAAEPMSRVLMAGAVVALVSNPIFGALSDSTRSRFGRRRPWLVGGVLCGCASLAVIGLAPTVNIVLWGWCAAQLAFNAVLAAMVAIVPDRVPPAQRGTVVGILGICMPIGQITGTFLVQLLVFNMTLALLACWPWCWRWGASQVGYQRRGRWRWRPLRWHRLCLLGPQRRLGRAAIVTLPGPG